MGFKIVIEHHIDESTQSFIKDLLTLVLSRNVFEKSDALSQALNEIKQGLSNLEVEMSNKFEGLRSEIAALRTVEDSAIALIKGFADQVEQAGNDESELALVVADMRSGREALAAALVQGTAGVVPEAIPMTRPVLTSDMLDPNNPQKDLGTSTQTTQSIKSPDAARSDTLDGPNEPTP